MRKLIQRCIDAVQLSLFRRNEVARFDGIILSDLRTRRSQTPHFRDILLDSLRLLNDVDPRRFRRVRRRIAWIVNQTLDGRCIAAYQHHNHICFIDFLEPSPEREREFLIGWYALTLIHEATHGVVFSRGIFYTDNLRSRIERLSVVEEQRFVTRLTLTHPDLADSLYQEFDAANWDWHWRASTTERLLAIMKRASTGK